MKQLFILLGWVIIITASSVQATSESPKKSRTFSPYFWVEGDDSSIENFPLKNTAVDVAITGVIANVTVRQRYSNMGGEPINGRYIFPGSTRAAVHGMKMIIGERVIRAKIKEKEEARTTYETAKKQGKNASLLEQQRPNVFSMEVANIMPGDTIEVELQYTEMLVPESGTYEFVYPTVAGPRYNSVSSESGSRGEQWMKNPHLTQGSEPHTKFDISVYLAAGMPLEEVSCQTHETNVNFEDDSRAHIALLQPEKFGGDRDYILHYRLAGRQISSGLALQKGEKENFFLLMVQPPKRVNKEMIPAREYIFVVDVSGSMHGFPLDTAKLLLEDLISSLQPTDTFNVLFFAGGSEVMAESSVPASPEQIRRAVKMIGNSNGGGGTELLKAMNRAMALPKQEAVSRTIIVVTDGYISAERDVFESIEKNLEHTNVFAFGIGSSVNRFLVEGMARSGQGEPFVVTTPEQAGPAAQKFRQYISNPVLTDIKIAFHGLDFYDVEPRGVPDLFGERPVVVYGKWRGEPSGTIELSGSYSKGKYLRTIQVKEIHQEDSTAGLDYLWARSRINRISDFNPRKTDTERRKEIVSLGLTYNLLTAFTSFVAVDEVVRNPEGGAKDVRQPLTLPKGVSNLAVSGGMRKVPEPGILALFVLTLAYLLLGVMQKRVHALNIRKWRGTR